MLRRCELSSLACCLILAALSAAAGSGPAGPAPLTREQLVGAWRLVRIDYAGPGGVTVDPFYQPGSEGLIVYDASGWMSCQIGAPRQARAGPTGVPGSRM